MRRTHWPSLWTHTAEPDTVSLLGSILQDAPPLRGAACVGRAELFDIDASPDHHAEARDICRSCPVLAQCGAWATAHPRRISGVVAGRRFVGPRPTPRRKVTA